MTSLPHHDTYHSYGNSLKRIRRQRAPINWGLIVAMTLNLMAWGAVFWIAQHL